MRALIALRAPGARRSEATTSRASPPGGSTAPSGCSTPRRPSAARQLLEVARAVYLDPRSTSGGRGAPSLALAHERGAEARTAVERTLERLEGATEREAEQRARRAERGRRARGGARALEELAAWYRDLVVVAVGAEDAALHSDRLAELAEDASASGSRRAERAAERVRETWRSFEEFNVQPQLALEALFVRLRRELDGARASGGRMTVVVGVVFSEGGPSIVRSGLMSLAWNEKVVCQNHARPGARARRAGEPRAHRPALRAAQEGAPARDRGRPRPGGGGQGRGQARDADVPRGAAQGVGRGEAGRDRDRVRRLARGRLLPGGGPAEPRPCPDRARGGG